MGKSKTKFLSKAERIERKRQKAQREEIIKNSLIWHNREKSSFRRKVEDLYNRRVSSVPSNQDLFNYFSSLNGKENAAKRTFFKDLLLFIEKQNLEKLLNQTEYLHGLFEISKRVDFIIRPLKKWKRKSHNAGRQFAELVQYLFCKYPVPEFMATAWMHPNNRLPIQWYMDLGSGMSARKLTCFPVKFTKRMAHLFTTAIPFGLSISEAIRWCQVRGLGGSGLLAGQIANSRLGRNNFQDETFWASVIQFMVNHAEVNPAYAPMIIDYLHDQKQLRPTLSMKGRSMEKLIQETEDWHIFLQKQRKGGKFDWAQSGINEFIFEDGKGEKSRIFKIIELCSSTSLYDEGYAMGHCVATYDKDCYQKRAAIFSMRCFQGGKKKSSILATIEVDLKYKKILQAKARFNEEISPDSQAVLELWAERERLLVSDYL